MDGADPGRWSAVAADWAEFLSHLGQLGASLAGIDPVPAMVELARSRVPGADLRLGTTEQLPWPDGTFDAVTAFNALQFADDTLDALAECIRVARPGGHVAVANWAEGDRNDLNMIEAAVAEAAGEALPPDGDLRQPCGLAQLLGEAGLAVLREGLVELPWEVPDNDTLIRAVLMGEDPATIAATAPTVLSAARPFRTPAGGYRLINAFRYAVGRTPHR